MYTVYKHTTPSGKVYIGITGRKPEQRWKNGNGYKNNKHLYSEILKYGWENIEHEIICQAPMSAAQAGAVEKSFIALYDSTNPDKGYNHSIGGECGILGVHPSDETRKKLSEALKGANSPWYGKHLSAETRLKISESHKGQPSPRKGAHLSPETRRKISESKKGVHHQNYGKHLSAETRLKISEANKGKHISAETRRKLSEASKGTHHSHETRKKMSESHKGKTAKAVVCVETGILYSSVTEAAKYIGVTQSAISNVVRGAQKTAGGYHWKYAK